MVHEIDNSNRGGNIGRGENVTSDVNATNQSTNQPAAGFAENAAPILQPRILIADDQPDVLEALRVLLKGHGYKCELGSSPAGIIDAITGREFDLFLMVLNY